jgi:hypothetical protein
MLAVLLSLRGPMWGNKKSHTPHAVDQEPKIWQTNQPPKPAPASWEGTTKIYKDVMGSAGATAWLELDGRELLHAMINSSRIPQPSTPPLRL